MKRSSRALVFLDSSKCRLRLRTGMADEAVEAAVAADGGGLAEELAQRLVLLAPALALGLASGGGLAIFNIMLAGSTGAATILLSRMALSTTSRLCSVRWQRRRACASLTWPVRRRSSGGPVHGPLRLVSVEPANCATGCAIRTGRWWQTPGHTLLATVRRAAMTSLKLWLRQWARFLARSPLAAARGC